MRVDEPGQEGAPEAVEAVRVRGRSIGDPAVDDMDVVGPVNASPSKTRASVMVNVRLTGCSILFRAGRAAW